MSSGEADVRTLDMFVRCEVAGCEFRVYAHGDLSVRCRAHGGRDGIPEYMTDADSGAFVAVRHMTQRVDCE